ncbi:16S rRNA (uracil1498-N3)-methyltransferase [Sphingobium wenxiniae]|uniref:Ribosomal RNA small subunit methyltransferase E n=1 Tax=Sphingobium wenxiniae (strain DSM 21828 / CGMCC 1.7748 / JZ-1) TaxID=595605 RepID=A0A562KBB9_SPHWJ|nr:MULTISPECIES: 16S rRNA (uracil(1498)-N(3))-methyltransferase [Sphingobium]MBB6192146.1 16S rRNA (uracil1498-N3)-methyltransferase [Sphingobium wenxiniae]TWH92523.1 16S rRNA (uracil1498-N3)-methyltransferase [Sphingobium wenxiniae]WRD75928.1 16S rRNA (uracil(1498)-N(3))-methyltransferase [Sphingobium baderi]
MTATPAWPPQSAPRLYVETPLGEGVAVPVEGNAAHYLIGVMRVKPDDVVLLFDGRSGEWAARARDIRKRDLVLVCETRTRPLEHVPDFWLCCAPIKKGRIDLIAEKACELGAAKLQPVLTRRAVVDRLNLDRLRAHLVEAAEQCGRTALPELGEMVKLDALLREWPDDRWLFFADETGGAPLEQALRAHPGPAAFLIGPEGGFDPSEREAIRAVAKAVPVSLGPRILRAETAAIAATSAWMALNGDWQ